MIGSLNILGLVEVLLLFFGFSYLVIRPLLYSPRGDVGQSMTQVILPTPHKVAKLRIVTIVLLSTAGALLGVYAYSTISAAGTYLEDFLAGLVLPNNAVVQNYISRSYMLIPFIAATGMISIALSLNAEFARKAMALTSTVWFIAQVVLATALLSLLAAATAMSTTLFQWIDTTLIIMVFGFLCFLNLVQVNLALPKSVLLPFKGPSTGIALAQLIVATITAAIISIVFFVLFAQYLSLSFPAAALGALFPLQGIYIGTYLVLLMTIRKPRKGIPPWRLPGISVIMPAYNEESIIRRTLEAIDRAAHSYDGVVYVVIADDGSTDSTREIVQSCFSSFTRAQGTLVQCPHRGKAATLNAALYAATTEIVVRIDADIVVTDSVFASLPAWFANSEIGMVGALDLPHPDLKAWYSYGRLYECLRSFAFSRLAQMRVNGIVCVPGTYTAFRRSVALKLNGFVEGMNGEDADLTIQFARLGYRIVIDTDIVIYEDVPQTWNEFRKQRIRWFRGGSQIYGRHFNFTKKNFSTIMYFGLEFSLSKFRAITHPVMFFGLGSVLLLFPGGYELFTKMIILLLFATIPIVILLGSLAIKFGYVRQLGWMLLYYFPFAMAKRLAAIEAILTIPTLAINHENIMAELVTDAKNTVASISLEPEVSV